MKTLATVVGAIVLSFAAIIGLSIIFAFPTKWLINYLFSDAFKVSIFGVTHLNIWRALCINILSATLLKSSVSKSK